jgi:hypothetical protein
MPDVSTVDIDALVERSGELKRELLEFAQRRRYSRPFRAALEAADLGQSMADEDSLIAVIDRFLLQHRLRNGRTVVEEFVAARSDLPEPERAMLLGWQDVVEGVFEVVSRERDAVVLENLVDSLTYRARSNMGAPVLRRMPRRSFVATRLVPVGDEWLISGTVGTFPARRRDAVYRVAAQEAVNNPELTFRNPANLARAWELQRADRERFVRFFGSDLVVMAGDEVDDRMRAFREACRSEIAGDRPGPLPPLVFEHTPDDDAETVAVIYDDDDGLGFYVDFGLLAEVFADPALLRRRVHRQRVLDYLDDDTIPPHVFRRLAARDEERASAVFRKLLQRPGFDWARDGEELLRARKPQAFDRPPRPSISVIPERLVPYVTQPPSHPPQR